ncbi:protoheme IX farnesyltransferase [Candidatus Riesia pediculicola]|uniref:heme o synthase n=1 Tax=Riesia pediculicola (strain USDA) TaxID=515618 RepID=D4G7X8_RIEPU|nr:protoheme IX farnesyltransferase [Candidatus Riesia pediculicola]ADD79730.1 protoheme IX farnesyltransferase [Candidatus Riesia pediculicola USDA]ARC53693.1 hypothetical protein AOE55_00780 [Candidatus Riesia pediculicola]QOJ86338.1 protoheme IX farnesyltransferase [Candidatus Riesia pediculicola]
MRRYFEIIKPKIVLGNLISSVCGLLIAEEYSFNFFRGFYVILSIFLIISSCFILNNFMDRKVDKIMIRTKNRILTKDSSKNNIFFLILSFSFLIIGLLILYKSSNLLSLSISIFGFSTYVLYTVLKKKTFYSIYLGSLSGSTPSMIAYCSISNRIDVRSIIIYITLFLWQIPHFYSISLLFLKDYLRAKIPILPNKIGLFKTKIHIFSYVMVFSILSIIPFFNGYVGIRYLNITIFVNLIWLLTVLQGVIDSSVSLKKWSKKSFMISIISINLFNCMFAIDKNLN